MTRRAASQRQLDFARIYVRTGNASEAYRMAGFKSESDEAVAANASRLITVDKVAEEIARLRALADDEFRIGMREFFVDMLAIAQNRKLPPVERMQAWDRIAKAKGWYAGKGENRPAPQVIVTRDMLDSI